MRENGNGDVLAYVARGRCSKNGSANGLSYLLLCRCLTSEELMWLCVYVESVGIPVQYGIATDLPGSNTNLLQCKACCCWWIKGSSWKVLINTVIHIEC